MEAKHADMKQEIKRAERRGSRKGFLRRITAFFVGLLCGMLIITCASAYVHGKNAADTFKSFFTSEEGDFSDTKPRISKMPYSETKRS